MRIAAVVLAGGRSSRFGRDKLAEPIDGHPMLELAIDAVRGMVDEIIVVMAPEATEAGESQVAGEARLSLPRDSRRVHDPRAFEGPLAGVRTGLASTDADLVLVVGGDMPSMVPAVLRRLVEALELRDAAAGQPAKRDGLQAADAVTLESGDDLRPLPMALCRRPALILAESLLASGERRLRALPAGLRAVVLEDADWRAVDPDGKTLRDIDTEADLG